jgi:hypothetical protein
MRSNYRKILYSAIVALLFANCSLFQKNLILSEPIVSLQKPEISDFEEVYIAKPISSRKKYFTDNDAQIRWADSIYSGMSLQEKVGQLFMVAAYSNKDNLHTNAKDWRSHFFSGRAFASSEFD